MRVAIVTDTLATLSGSDASVVSTAEQLARAGNGVAVFAFGVDGPVNPTWTQRLKQAGVALIERLAAPHPGGITETAFSADIVAYLERWRADVIHAIPMESLRGQCTGLGAALPGVPIVGTVTSDPSPRCFWYNADKPDHLARYTTLVALSPRIAAGVLDYLCPTAVVREVPLLVDLPARAAALSDAELARRHHLGAITRLRVEKGYEFLLASIAILARTHPQVTVSLYGETPELERARHIAQALGIAGRIGVKGPFKGQFEIDRVVSSHSIFLLSSLFEGTPLALIETALRGRLSVATDVGGVADVMEVSGAGLLVPAADPAAMAKATADLLDDPERMRALSADAIVRTARYYSADRIIERLLAVYRDAISRAAG